MICLIFYNKSSSQWLTQGAEGSGSFLFKGSDISFDLIKTDLSFTLNNLNNPVKISKNNDNKFLFFGGGLDTKAKGGAENFFNGKDIVPAGNVNLYLGIQFSNSYNKLYKAEQERLSAQLVKVRNQQVIDFKSKMDAKIDEEILASPKMDSAIIKKIKRDWKDALTKLQPRSFLDYLKTYKPDDVTVANIIPSLLVSLEMITKENTLDLEHISGLLAGNREDNIRSKLWRFSIFLFGAVDGSSFKRVEKIDSNNLANSFIKEDYHGNSGGVGINFQVSGWKIGATYAYRKTNNFGLLDNLDYKLNSIVTANGQSINKEQTINAYTGNYGTVEINELNADIMYSLNLGSTSDTYALLDAYFRGQFFSRSKDLLPQTYNVGLGGYFYTKKSRLMGGLYIELPDIENYFAKNQSTSAQNTRSSVQRLTFGIVAKYSLNALISHQ